MLLEILLIVFPTYGITNESERFSEKILTSLVRRRNEHFREMQGSRMHSFGPGVNRRANSLKSILSSDLTQQIISVLLLKSTIRKLFAGYARAGLKIIFGIRRSKMFWCTR